MKHTCHARGCDKEVPPRLFMCLSHWHRLPKPMRVAIWREYNDGQEAGKAPVTPAYLKVTREAIEWLATESAEARQGKLPL